MESAAPPILTRLIAARISPRRPTACYVLPLS